MTSRCLSAAQIQTIVNPRVAPTPEQTAIIESNLRPHLVVAGAGSGKTETMAMRVLWLVANDENITPASILGLTFTKKAAGELGERLRSRLRRLGDVIGAFDPNEEPVALTYNAFAQRIVAEHGLRIGVDPDFAMLGEAGAVQLMHDIITTWPVALDDVSSLSTAVTSGLHLAGQISEHGLSLEQARLALEEFSAELEAVGDTNLDARAAQKANRGRIALLDPIGEYQRRKRDMGVLDFADQLFLATRIVTESPEAVAQIRNEHRAVLLDEFQDTSVIQMTLLSTLFHDHPVTAVGDPNQAIYGWRGASASSLESFLSRFHTGAPSVEQTRTLSTAWRNDRRILVAANRVAAPLRSDTSIANSPILTQSPKAGEGEVEIAYTGSKQQQIDAVVDYVESRRSARADAPPSMAILCRRRADFLPLDTALRERGIPTQIIGLGGLLDQPGVIDVRCALEITHDVSASTALTRLLIRADLGAADLVILNRWAARLATQAGRDRHSALLIEAVDSPPPPGWSPGEGEPAFSRAAHDRVSSLGERLRQIRRLHGRGLVDIAERAMRILGILDDAICDPVGRGGREALDAFVDVIAEFESEAVAPTLGAFLTWLSFAQEEERGLTAIAAEPDPATVQILTIHGAKGLEWDHVAIVGMSDSIFPLHRGKNSVHWRSDPPSTFGWVNDTGELPHPLRGDYADLPAFDMDLSNGRTPSSAFKAWLNNDYKPALGRHAEAEERRLAYVALTRARHSELLVGSWMNEATTPKHPSRYLMESYDALLDDSRRLVSQRTATRGDGASHALTPEQIQRAQRNIEALEEAIAPEPSAEEAKLLAPEPTRAMFPVAPGPSRRLIMEAAAAVRQEMAQMPTNADAFALLTELGPDPRVSDITALLEELRIRAQSRDRVIIQDQVPATSVAALLDDPDAFALDIRRPMPREPLPGAGLGTVFHAWAERQLRQVSGELWDEPIIGVDALTEAERVRLKRMQENFAELDIVVTGTPEAVEEPFAVNIAGIVVSGRIDAVFTRPDGATVIVDWKSGMAPDAATDPAKLRYYATQLRLYRLAWSQAHAVPLDSVTAQLAFVAQGSVMSLDQVEHLAGIDPSVSLDDLLRGSLNR